MFHRLLLFGGLGLFLVGCGSFNENDLLTDSVKIASCPPGCAANITAKPEQLMVSIDPGTYSIKAGADKRLDITGTCYSPYPNHAIYFQISTSVPATASNARTTSYMDINTGTSNSVTCVAGKFSASVSITGLSGPAGYYLTGMIRAVSNGQTIDNTSSGGLSYTQFTVTQ